MYSLTVHSKAVLATSFQHSHLLDLLSNRPCSTLSASHTLTLMELCQRVVISKTEHRPTKAGSVGDISCIPKLFHFFSSFPPCQFTPCTLIHSTPSPLACLWEVFAVLKQIPNQLVWRVRHCPLLRWRHGAKWAWRKPAYKLVLCGLYIGKYVVCNSLQSEFVVPNEVISKKIFRSRHNLNYITFILRRPLIVFVPIRRIHVTR